MAKPKGSITVPLLNRFTRKGQVDREKQKYYATKRVGARVHFELDLAGRLEASLLVDVLKSAECPVTTPKKFNELLAARREELATLSEEEQPEAQTRLERVQEVGCEVFGSFESVNVAAKLLLAGRFKDRDGNIFKLVDAQGATVKAKLFFVRWNPDGKDAYGQSQSTRADYREVNERLSLPVRDFELVQQPGSAPRFAHRRNAFGGKMPLLHMQGTNFREYDVRKSADGLGENGHIYAKRIVMWCEPGDLGCDPAAKTMTVDPAQMPYVMIFEDDWAHKALKLWSLTERELNPVFRALYVTHQRSNADERAKEALAEAEREEDSTEDETPGEAEEETPAEPTAAAASAVTAGQDQAPN